MVTLYVEDIIAGSSISSSSCSSSRSSSSRSSSCSSRSSSSSTAQKYCWGEENPVGEQKVSWAVWSDGEGGSPTIDGDPDWGSIVVGYSPGERGLSHVTDMVALRYRKFTVIANKYGTGAGRDAVIYIRGSATIFTQDAATPTWEAYTTPIQRSWRYVQVRTM